MKVLFATGSPEGYMRPPQLSDEQVVCGPDWPDRSDAQGRVLSLNTPLGRYDLAAVVARLPKEQLPDVVACLVDASWRNLPGNLGGLGCPKVLLVADTHHMGSPLLGMMSYMASERFDRTAFVYDRHHASFFHAAGFRNLFWLPGLTLPHDDAVVNGARAKWQRARRLAFVGQAGKFHFRRARLIESLVKRHLPFDARSLTQAEGLRFYGSSSLGFNASLNGDLNLRTFEILASGSALVTDRLSPESGLGTLLKDGRDAIIYGSAEELCERVAHALANPSQARAIGEAGARMFDDQFNLSRRRDAFSAVAFGGAVRPEFEFTAEEKSRVFFGGDTSRLLHSVAAYEVLQELQRTMDTVTVGVDKGAHPDVPGFLSSLPWVACAPPSGSGAVDVAVVGRAEAHAGPPVEAPLVWCCDAEQREAAAIAAALAPSGYSPLNADAGLFKRGARPAPVPQATRHGGGQAQSSALPDRDQPTSILIYCDDPKMGGVGHHCMVLARAAAGEGRQVHYAQPRFEHPLLARALAEGVRIDWISFDTAREFGRTVSDTSEASRIFDGARPDLVIFADCCHISNIAAKHTAISRGIPFIVVCHSSASYHAKNFAQCLPVVRGQLSKAIEVVAVSHSTLEVTRSHYGLEAGRGVVVHGGRPPEFFEPRSASNRLRIRRELGVRPGAVVSLTAARVCEDKGFTLQLMAILELKKEGRLGPLEFIWAGDGDLLPEIRRILGSRGLEGCVHCTGPRADIAALCDASDIFILPTLHEAFGLSIAEAMGKRLAVVASRVGGIPEVLGDTGLYLSDPMSGPKAAVAEIKAHLMALAGNPRLVADHGERAHARSASLFTEGRMQSELSAIVGSCLERTAGRGTVTAGQLVHA